MLKFTKDYYAILKVNPSASADEIRIAYRLLAKQNHPDLGGSQRVMSDINEAYSVLSDPATKQKYDTWYNNQKAQQRRAASEHEMPEPLTIHILDPDSGYRIVHTDTLSVPRSVRKMINNSHLYTYIEYDNSNKPTRVCISLEDFIEMQKLYGADEIACICTNYKGNTRTKTIRTADIANNYRRFMRPGADNIYIRRDHDKVYAVTHLEFTQLCKRNENKYSNITSCCILGCIAIAVCLFIVFNDWHAGPVSVQTSPHFPSASAPSPVNSSAPTVPLPAHGTVYATYSYPPNFQIHTHADNYAKYYFLKLKDANTGNTVQTVFIYSGQATNIFVPYGTYVLQWTCGSQWYGADKCFGENTATQADDTFTFDDETAWEVTLYPVTNGNLTTDEINIEDF